MRHGSLFSGIGGFDLAAEWMGWENVFHCEWMEFPRKVLDYYWPNADSHIDICKTDFTKYANTIDILTGGFPCQPFSLAGKRKGTNDERYLWHEMLRAIQEIKPKFVIAENVFGITNIDGGLVFEQVCLDLEAEGYEVQPFIIPAAGKNAPHRRDRVWFVAHRSDGRCEYGQVYSERCKKAARIWKVSDKPCNTSQNRNATNTNGNGLNERNRNDEVNTSERGINAQCNIEQSIVDGNFTNSNSTPTKYKIQTRRNLFTSCVVDGNATDTDNSRNSSPKCGNYRNWSEKSNKRKQPFDESCRYVSNRWKNFPTQSPICGGDDGLPTKLDGIAFPKWRNESIKAYGNAIVPQVAYELFKQLK